MHFPWCLKKCPYCDFLSVAAPRSEVPHRGYADAVLAELDRRAEVLGARTLRSVFFGGGTPSLWRTTELGRVLSAIRRRFPGEPEVTVECNPTSFDADVARGLLDAGVNRVSLGVQSLDSARLAFLGRLHDVEGGLRAVETALSTGVPRVSADLIFGVHGQRPEEAAGEAARLAATGITHLSAYALTIEPGTQFGALARKNRLPLLGEDLVAQSFVAVDDALTRAGFEHYEISNFARDGHFAEHNLGYWRGDEYLGLGCGAWGTVQSGDRSLRYRNTPSPERYLESGSAWGEADLARAGSLIQCVEEIDGDTALKEQLMLGLRLAAGVDLERASRRAGAEAWPPARERAVRRLVDRGRLRRDGARLVIPKDAWLFADGTIAELL